MERDDLTVDGAAGSSAYYRTDSATVPEPRVSRLQIKDRCGGVAALATMNRTESLQSEAQHTHMGKVPKRPGALVRLARANGAFLFFAAVLRSRCLVTRTPLAAKLRS